MSLASLLLFAGVYLAAVAAPGPGTVSVVARVLAQGTGGLAAYIAGFVLGDLIWFAIAATGLAVMAQTFAGVMIVLRLAGAAYLLWVAYQLWTAPATVGPASASRGGGLRATLAGLSLTLGNPKVIVFFLALLPSVIDLEALTPLGAAELAALMAILLSAVLAGYGLAAARARRLFTTARAMRRLNRGASVVMAGAAAVVATR